MQVYLGTILKPIACKPIDHRSTEDIRSHRSGDRDNQ